MARSTAGNCYGWTSNSDSFGTGSVRGGPESWTYYGPPCNSTRSFVSSAFRRRSPHPVSSMFLQPRREPSSGSSYREKIYPGSRHRCGQCALQFDHREAGRRRDVQGASRHHHRRCRGTSHAHHELRDSGSSAHRLRRADRFGGERSTRESGNSATARSITLGEALQHSPGQARTS